MTNAELIRALVDIMRRQKANEYDYLCYHDDHFEADQLLLKYIDDDQVTSAFESIEKPIRSVNMEWISINDRIPDVFAGIYPVRRKNGIEMEAFYYMDSIAWIAFYGHKPSHWWDSEGSHDRLDDVTHWKDHNKL